MFWVNNFIFIHIIDALKRLYSRYLRQNGWVDGQAYISDRNSVGHTGDSLHFVIALQFYCIRKIPFVMALAAMQPTSNALSQFTVLPAIMPVLDLWAYWVIIIACCSCVRQSQGNVWWIYVEHSQWQQCHTYDMATRLCYCTRAGDEHMLKMHALRE